ncbi:MAG TPA: nitroreductase [Gemmatimonadaceae bacterium]|nr:nitroreductase [Gemmatimonadaceae bacterium]
MHVLDAIQTRRSIKRFTDRPVSRSEIEAVLSAAAFAPNHRLTLPWRFYVLGPEARHAYGLALGDRKARKLTDPDAVATLRQAMAAEQRALPCMIAIAVVTHDDPEIREEDYAAAMMAIQNLSLAAVELGLGTHIKTGAVMSTAAARAAVGVPDDQRIIAVVNLGEPASIPPEKPRRPASEHTRWLE